MKKLAAAMVLSALLLGLLRLPAQALDTEEAPFSLRETVMQEAHDSYYRSRRTAGVTSFHGRCGLLAGHQLYNLGINTGREVFNGNDHYDYYLDREVTTGGYYITPYSCEAYTLQEALQAVSHNGTWDVRNVLVCFQWTNTEAGRRFGHVMLINGIIGGTVYFVESFPSSLGAEGAVISCSIEEFARYYDRWTQFEGLVHFGKGTYHDVCPHETTDLLVQTRFPTALRSEPAVVGEQGCVRLRSVAAGERLHATAIYEAEHALYYRVDTIDGYAFIPAGAVSVLQISTQGVQLTDFAMPSYLNPGTVPLLKGTVTDLHGSICSVEVCITDAQGNLVRRELTDGEQPSGQLETLRDELYFDLLEPGYYQVDIYAGRSTPVAQGGSTTQAYARTQLHSWQLQVGGDPRQVKVPAVITSPVRDGWFWEQGTWYCYENGDPRTGWVSHLGVRYYLRSDGSVTTGEQQVEGKSVYFSAGGALVTGWLTVNGSTTYRAADGTAVTGRQQIDGQLYSFDENGVMLTEEIENG